LIKSLHLLKGYTAQKLLKKIHTRHEVNFQVTAKTSKVLGGC